MLRRIGILCLVALLAVAVAVAMTGCFEQLEIVRCHEGPKEWFGRAPLTVCVRAIMRMGSTASWDFGDGGTGAEKTATHTYTEVGEYTVTLNVIENSGKLNSTSITVVVAGDPEAAFTYDVYDGTVLSSWFSWLPSWLFGNQEPEDEDESVEIKFFASMSYPSDTTPMYLPTQLHWDYGDGSQETVAVYAKSWWGPSRMTVRHIYAAPGTYDVTMTLTDNLGYSDSVTHTIIVGADDDDDVEIDDFTVGTITWELRNDDEEEEPHDDDYVYDEGNYLFVEGTVRNNAAVSAGVELTATAYNATGTPVGTHIYWPTGTTSTIGPGVTYAFHFSLRDLTVPGSQVATVEVVVSDVKTF